MSTKLDMSKILSDTKRTLMWSREDDERIAEEYSSCTSEDNGILFWKASSEKGKFIELLVNDIKLQMNIQDKDIDGYALTIVKPNNVDYKRTRTIPRGSLATGYRVICSLGSREQLEFGVEDPRNNKALGSSKVMIDTNQVVMLPFGPASMTSLTFDDAKSFRHRYRENFRDKTYTKNPENRNLIVVDFLINPASAVTMIKSFLGKKEATQEQVSSFEKDVEEALRIAKSQE